MKFDIPDEDFQKYLIELGYVPIGSSEPKQFEAATAEFQADMLLPVTGESDELTKLTALKFPRCGVTDAPSARGEMSAWGLKTLTYYIASKVTNNVISAAQYDAAVAECFAVVSSCCGLKFKRVQSAAEANLILDTGRGSRAGLDGQSGTLGFAYLPPNGSYAGKGAQALRLVLDLDELWLLLPPATRGILIKHVLMHEILHLLGLDHTRTPGQLMLAFYSASIGVPQKEDRTRLVERYDEPEPAQPPVTPPPTPTDPSADQVAAKVSVNGVIYGPAWLPKAAAVTLDRELVQAFTGEGSQ